MGSSPSAPAKERVFEMLGKPSVLKTFSFSLLKLRFTFSSAYFRLVSSIWTSFGRHGGKNGKKGQEKWSRQRRRMLPTSLNPWANSHFFEAPPFHSQMSWQGKQQ